MDDDTEMNTHLILLNMAQELMRVGMEHCQMEIENIFVERQTATIPNFLQALDIYQEDATKLWYL
jgi:RIO-like serine/threonine protein kinase